MENFNIENAKTRFFESKEHYLNFRQAWKDFHNSDKLVWHEDVDVTFWDAPATQERVFARKKFTSLNSSHYMLYNLLRGYDIKYGFTPLTTGKDHLKWNACDWAAADIFRTSKRLENVNAPSTAMASRRYAREAIDELLLPFDGHVTHEALRDVGEWLNINIFNNQNYPQFEVEEYKDFEKEDEIKSKMSISDRIKEWRTA